MNAINKLSGRKFEILVEDVLESMGFIRLGKTKISGDYGVDLIGYLQEKKHAIQIKRWSRPVNLKSVQEVYTGMKFYGAESCVVVTNNVFTKAAQELAQKCSCKLIAGEDIKGWVDKRFQTAEDFFRFLENKKITKYRVSSEDLVKEFMRVKSSMGRQPTISEMDSNGKFSSSAYRKRWGTWNNFLRSINQPLIQDKSITNEALKADYYEVKRKMGRAPTRKDMVDVGKYGKSMYDRRFGGWNKFLESIDQSQSITKKHMIPRDEFVNEFKRVKSRLGHAPNASEMRKYGNIAPNTYKRLWGSWSNFLKEQGENYRRINIPEKELVKAYLKLKKQLRKNLLTQKDMNQYGEFSSSVYERRFGSWNKFLNYIGDKKA